MKKYILSIVALICFGLNAQITSYHLVYVKSKDQPKFEEVEKKYHSKLVQNAVKEGDIQYWCLEKIIYPAGISGGRSNMPGMGNVYQFVQVHKDIEAYIDQLSNPWWTDAAKKLKVKIEDISWPSDVEQMGIYVWKIQDSAWEGMGNKRPKFSLYNFGVSLDPQKFLDAQAPWKQQFIDQMKNNEAGRAGWSSGTRIMPNNGGEHNVFTWDGFTTLGDVFRALSGNIMNLKNTEENWAMSNGFDLRFVAEKIVETN